MAAAVAISLYVEMPRVAFESQRAKEQLLIERGEQYKRAIQVFVRKNKRYPGRIEELENTNNVRYLRKRYLDPMTGKDKWRVVHVGPGGIFTDSVLNKPPKPGSEKDKDKEKDKPNPMTQIAVGPSLGGSVEQEQPQEPEVVMRRRQSEMRAAYGPGGAMAPGGGTAPGQMPGDPQAVAGGMMPVPGQPGMAQAYPPQTGMPQQAFPGQQPGFAQPGAVAQGSFPPGVGQPENTPQDANGAQGAFQGLNQNPQPYPQAGAPNPWMGLQQQPQQGGFPPGARSPGNNRPDRSTPPPARCRFNLIRILRSLPRPASPWRARRWRAIPGYRAKRGPGDRSARQGAIRRRKCIQNILMRPRPGGFPGADSAHREPRLAEA